MKIVIQLNEEQLEHLSKAITGSGGWQGLLRRLQQGIRGNELSIAVGDLEAMLRYAKKYGDGGWEGRIRRVLPEVFELAEAVLRALAIPVSALQPQARPNSAGRLAVPRKGVGQRSAGNGSA